MPTYHDPESFIKLRDAGLPLLDARSPSEHLRGSIPGARSLPVLSDEERAAVGLANARGGNEAAVRAALELVGPGLAGRLEEARRVIGQESAGLDFGSDVLVHCWRGGMRSASLAWLLECGGFRVHVLRGGYKAYRAWGRAILAGPANVLVLGGLTGSGKTDVLRALAALGGQVADLEALAGHRGSVFGGIGLPRQPSLENLENRLADLWRSLDPARPVWLEDEDRRIGDLALSEEFYRHIRQGRLVWLEIPRQARLERLVRLYATDPQAAAALPGAIERLHKRLGDEAARVCAAAVRAGRFYEACDVLLAYYDKYYLRQKDRLARPQAGSLVLDRDAPLAAAEKLLEIEDIALEPQS